MVKKVDMLYPAAKAVRPLLPNELEHLKENSAEYRELSKAQLPPRPAGQAGKP